MINDKKGASVWISAVLYFGVGIVILTLIMTAGMPVINRMRDKNVAVQTKEVFHGLDKTLREVAKEGPGSQRVSNLDIKKGSMDFSDENDFIKWKFDTTAVLSEPGIPAEEGNIVMLTKISDVEGEYFLTYTLDYGCLVNIAVAQGSSLNSLSGPTKLIMTNLGTEDNNEKGDCDQPRTKVQIREA